jgi:hypothetical protein
VRRSSDGEEENEDIEVEEDEFFNIDAKDRRAGEANGLTGKDKKLSKKEQFRKKLKEEKNAKRTQPEGNRPFVNDKRKQANQLANLELLTKRQGRSQGDFELNMEDERFGRFKSDPSMAIDPTVPDYDAEKSKGLLEFKKNSKPGKDSHQHGNKKLKMQHS